jgi:hypothetical protein
MVRIFCTHVSKWKIRTVSTETPGIGGVRKKKTDGGVNSVMIYCENLFLNVTMYPQYNNNKNKLIKLKSN